MNPAGAWRQNNAGWELYLQSLPQGACGEADDVDCYDTAHYLREMFINSETHVAVLSAVPADPGENPLEIAEQKATMDLVGQLAGAGSQRLVIHGLVLPDQGQAEIEGMAQLAEEIGVAAWKVYTPYGGWRLDGDDGLAFLDEARRLGVDIVCAHKGLPLPGFDPQFASPADIGVVAPQYADLRFVVYHSGYEPSIVEGGYDPTARASIA